MTQKEEFLQIFTEKIKRDGADKLLEWLKKSDFFEAPASTKFHLAEYGGLCTHSVNVYHRLCRLWQMEYGAIEEKHEESIAISALLHDLCKVNFYSESTRNVKKDGKWEAVPFFTVDEKLKYGGHGSKSVFLAERFIRLEIPEAIAINCHMSVYDRPSGDYTIGSAYEHCHLALLLHQADELASYIDEAA